MNEAQNILTEQDPPAIYYGQLASYTILGKDIQGLRPQPALPRQLQLLRHVARVLMTSDVLPLSRLDGPGALWAAGWG